MAIRFANGGVWQAGGADNPDTWRGGYADEVIVDEFDDVIASLVPLVIEPMLADRDGVLVRSGTPKGNGLLEAAYRRAVITPGYSAYLLPYQKTGALSPEAIERLRSEMTAEEFAQEMECSFESPRSGSYYGDMLQAADVEGRVSSVPYDSALPVITAWDLGMDDSTAIWFCQITRGGEWHIIDYLENSGESLDYYVKELKNRDYVYDRHLLPHDAKVRELGTGKSRVETLSGLGLRLVTVVPMQSVADGINAVKMTLPKCWFDAKRCEVGLKALRHYHREWNEKAQTWHTAPTHDGASHSADAFRYLAIAARPSRATKARDRYDDRRTSSRGRGSAMAA